ncbi:MAG TPA: hypothetical protein VNA69_03840 [Thermoanaerobaculia bacterium]|nr:hypothetical protein [Thermoanaerobaculia bacterium]
MHSRHARVRLDSDLEKLGIEVRGIPHRSPFPGQQDGEAGNPLLQVTESLDERLRIGERRIQRGESVRARARLDDRPFRLPFLIIVAGHVRDDGTYTATK